MIKRHYSRFAPFRPQPGCPVSALDRPRRLALHARGSTRERRLPTSPLLRRALLAALCLLLPSLAHAHAILVASQPPAGGSVAAGPIAMEFRYNSRIDRGRSRLTLTRPDHSQTVLTIAPDGPPDLLTTNAVLTEGAYTVRWQVLAVDGHITRGDVPFTVTGH
jgi:copper resistance protein C